MLVETPSSDNLPVTLSNVERQANHIEDAALACPSSLRPLFFSFLLFIEHKTLPEFLIHSPDSYYQLITYSIRLYAGLPPSFFGPLRILPLAGPAACFFLMDTSVFPMA
jgi:hypothetical protein